MNLNKITLIAVLAVLMSGCDSYSTYTKCVLVEEQKSTSNTSAKNYCNTLVDKGEISCDGETIGSYCY